MLSNRTRRALEVGLASTDARNEIASALGFQTFGTVYYVDYGNGNDTTNDGLSMDSPFKTVAKAYSKVTSNAHDVIAMNGNDAHTFSDELTVTKNRVHFVGLGGGGRWEGQRCRWEMGTTTGSAIAVLQVTGVGCTFTNIKIRSTDDLSTSLYAVADGGEFTKFTNCSFEKDEDLDQTGAAELLCNGDTSLYVDCAIGNTIYTVSVARACILFTRGTITGKVARDVRFVGCTIQNKTSATTSIHCKATTTDIERKCIFQDCIFWTAKLSSATQAVVFGIASALTQGMVLLKDCTVQNVTDVCATALGVYTNSPTPATDGTESTLVATT